VITIFVMKEQYDNIRACVQKENDKSL